MTRFHLAFKAFDCHELLCHAVARKLGLYDAHELEATLLDSTFIPDDQLPPNTHTVACGAVLAAFLQGGARHRVVFVACDRPMFWVYGRPGMKRLDQLKGDARIATFPEAAPPAGFLRKLLAEAGLSPKLLPCRDDTARLGLLCAGAVDAALLSSHFLPHQLESGGLSRLAFVGERLRLPSTGLAVAEEWLERAPDEVAGLVSVFRQAMHVIFSEDDLTCDVLAETFRIPPDGLHRALRAVRRCYNPSGLCEAGALQDAVDHVARSMERESRPATALYDFSFLEEIRARE